MSMVIYFDTSALAKWYINETGSEEVERYIQANGPVAVSDLTIVEMRCLLARRRRENHLSPQLEAAIFATFQDDIRRRFLINHPFPVDLAAGTINLMALLSDIPVRALDAMHLVIPREIGANVLVTSDRIMAEAARALLMTVVSF
jgi:uncharacterized protein